MKRIKEFTIRWCDAWGNYEGGMFSVLETGENITLIHFLVNRKPITLDITATEDDFIKQLEEHKIQNIDNWDYCNKWVLDGDMWSLWISFDETEICSRGCNAYPKEFIDLLTILHSMGLPTAKYEESLTEKRKYTKEKIDLKCRITPEYLWLRYNDDFLRRVKDE